MENQDHRTTDLILTISLVTVSVAMCAFILSRGMLGQDKHLAQDKAQSLAIQLLNGGIHNLGANNSRGPASVENSTSYLGKLDWKGQISVDPWGHPFIYYIEKGSSGEVSSVFVLSGGPDGKIETIFPENADNFQILSDDIGVQHKVQM